LTDDALDVVPLAAGSRLVIDFSPNSIRAGSTSALAIGRYVDAGVDVFSCEGLHAKVFVFGNRAIVGSSNVSKHSASGKLVEAAVESSSVRDVVRARTFVQSVSEELVTPSLVRERSKLPVRRRGPAPSRPTRQARPRGQRVWVVNARPMELEDWEASLGRRVAEQARTQLLNRRTYHLEELWFPASSDFARRVSRGDSLILVWSEGSRLEVWPAARVLGRRTVPGRRSGSRVLLAIERADDATRVSWDRFRRAAARSGLRVSPSSSRAVPLSARPELFALWE
jgi:hypothetical protein